MLWTYDRFGILYVERKSNGKMKESEYKLIIKNINITVKDFNHTDENHR